MRTLEESKKLLSEQSVTANGVECNVGKLVQETKHLSVKKCSVTRFSKNLNGNPWIYGDESFTLLDFISHSERVNASDLKFPILVLEGSDIILDGMHRLIKSILVGKTAISVREVPEDLFRKCAES